jgi:hypothetical protein
MSTGSPARPRGARHLLVPTLTKQCWGFMVGSALFALGSAPGFADWAGNQTANICFFVGALFFTTAGFIQLALAGAVTAPASDGPGRVVRAEWLAASTQSVGTIMFNVSTSAALVALTTTAEKHHVWRPDAAGSVAFLVSGWLALVAYRHENHTIWQPGRADWWSTQVNFVGCIAFGVSAVGAYVLPGGGIVSTNLANWGTFIGALCFLLASLVVLPFWTRTHAVAAPTARA